MNKLSLKRIESVPDLNDLWSDDVLERRLYAPVLTSLVGDSVEPLVVALNGGWGTGKTFFLNRWGQEFERPLSNDCKAGRVIYFRAWQDDDLEDPLLAIIGQLHRSLHARENKIWHTRVPNLKKMDRVTHQDVGQMDMYVRIFDEIVKQPDDGPTIGIVLCAETDPDIARYSILKGNEQLFATKYKLKLPTPQELNDEVARQSAMLRLQFKASAKPRREGK